MATNESEILDLRGANAKAKAAVARRALSLHRAPQSGVATSQSFSMVRLSYA